MLLQCFGFGFERFLPQPGADLPLLAKPLLVLVQDEGSPNTAVYWYLRGALGLRVHLVRDVFHREWNDCKLALHRSKLWGVVLLMMLSFNVAYGPWEGAVWFAKVSEGARDLFSKLRSSDPLWRCFYEAICHDKSEPCTGSPEHMEQVLKEVAQDPCWDIKGPRAKLGRWFEWLQAVDFHDRAWHLRLLVMTYVGMELKVYKSLETTPFFTQGAGLQRGEDEEP
eukprot:7102802-Lingulodinium_polyedra.AAC.1